ncbi:hypothetical protein [Microbacterium arabinogalactanolyticum]|uniref:hypothetical protein n=1 Tax=Microbacterium arabinogalactanolyticum TaxID=69365 RepID=UPI0025564117|nr:hypothetical protein [Microbacterium arabinogalactanolyticum]GLC84502.1 hypothetical protein MIAR_10900 [Microbacterium arabinogalactanolyticum]
MSDALTPGIVSHDDDRLPYDLSDDFEMVFTVERGGFAPRTAVYALAVEAAESTGSRIPSPSQVYAALRARGFREGRKHPGTRGFHDLTVPDRLLGVPRVQPDGTASAYKNRGERTPEAREAARMARVERWLAEQRRVDMMTNQTPKRDERDFIRRSPWFTRA